MVQAQKSFNKRHETPSHKLNRTVGEMRITIARIKGHLKTPAGKQAMDQKGVLTKKLNEISSKLPHISGLDEARAMKNVLKGIQKPTKSAR